MPKFVVYLTNPDDQSNAKGLSYTSGNYGFTVSAPDMGGAIDAVIARARTGFYGHDWSAKISQLDQRGHVDWRSDRIIALRDDLAHPAFANYAAYAAVYSDGIGTSLPGGGVVLW